MFSLWYLSLAIDEYRRTPLFKTEPAAESNGKQATVIPAKKDNNLNDKKTPTEKYEPPKPKEIEKSAPKPEPAPAAPVPITVKDPFDAKLNEIAKKQQQPKLPAKDQFDEKLAEISSIVSPTKNPSPPVTDLTPKTPPSSPMKNTFEDKLNDPFEATLAEYSSDFDMPAEVEFDEPNQSNQFQDPFDQKLTELSSKQLTNTKDNKPPLSNVDTLQEEDPLDKKLRELSTKYNEKLESTKNIKLPELESTFENLTRES